MPETESKNRACKTCGKPVVDNDGSVAHDGGGMITQTCKNCGWSGGQYGKYTQCPRCGDMTSLVDDHAAN